MQLKCYLMFIMNIIGCLCNSAVNFLVDPKFGNMFWPTDVELETTTQNVLQCVRLCSNMAECHSLVFYNGNNTCYGMKSVTPSSALVALPGAVFYKPVYPSTTNIESSTTTRSTTIESSTTTPTTTNETPTTIPITTIASPTTTPAVTESPATTTSTVPQTCGTTTHITVCGNPAPMVAPVADSQISASSHYDQWVIPSFCRLNNVQYWGSGPNPVVGEYIQVDFQSLRVATTVITQGVGDAHNYDQRVTSYTVSTSIDCVTFCAILDIDGAEQIFPGNTDKTSSVTNNLEPPVLVRCVRINPQTWYGHISMRFEVMGCIAWAKSY